MEEERARRKARLEEVFADLTSGTGSVPHGGGAPTPASPADAVPPPSPPHPPAAPSDVPDDRTFVNGFGTFTWASALEAAPGDVAVGAAGAAVPWAVGPGWLPQGHQVERVLAVRFSRTTRACTFLCKLDHYALDTEHHWYRGFFNQASSQGWLTASGINGTAPPAVRAFLRRYSDVARELRVLLTDTKSKKKARQAGTGPADDEAQASNVRPTDPVRGTARPTPDTRPVRGRPRAAATTARAALLSLAVAEAADKHPLVALSVRAQAAAAARREAGHPLVAVRRACRPPGDLGSTSDDSW